MFASLLFAWIWLLSQDMKNFSEIIVAVSVFASNTLFWRTSGYFDSATEFKPLIHTCSLSVDEQYYVLFPLFLLFVWNLGRRWIVVFLSLIAVISLGTTILFTPSPTTTPAPTTPTTTEAAPTTPPPTTGGPFTKPTLVNPVSPLSYGAKCDGVTNDAAAFQSALNASDVLVPAGKTCVVNSTVQISTNNRHLECEAGAVIKQTNLNAASLFRYIAAGEGRMSGNSIVNCTFIGTNTVPPQANWNDTTKHYNIPVKTEDRVDNFFLAGNTFDRFWGQSMFQTYGGVDGGRGDQIVYNTFKNCGYYGPVLVAHQNGYIGHNTMVDCATGVENDNPGQLNGGNIIEFNTLTCTYGYGGADMGACTMLTGGAAGKSNNSGNIVRNNTISGTSNGQGPQGVQGSRLIIGKNWAAEGVIPAQYSNNVCGAGCVITP
ncbi:MAG: hypothetical protein JWR42_2990 [Marmoricola sp.]|nr:hypothetical protein [Marmoricola sp.]